MPKEDAIYRRSRFTLVFEENQQHYILNTMTKQCLECHDPMNGSYPGQKISSNPTLKEYMENYFLVPEGKDETAFYENTYRLMQAFLKKRKAWLYTIFPTLGCNARCVYCFEEGMKPVRMSADTIEQTIKFIAEQPHEDEVALSWFGGEPLVEVGIIDQICQGLSARGVQFRSSMVTNGSLIDEEVLRKMLGPWNLQTIQVSMDGNEQSYIQRKKYPVYKDEYHKVIHFISRMAESGILVNVRCNVDAANVEGAAELIEDLKKTVSAKEQIRVSFGVLNQARDSENDIEVWKKALGLWDIVTDAGFLLNLFVGPYTGFRRYHCMADEGNINIAPDGNLYPCEYCPEDACFGNVRDGITHPEVRSEFISTGHLQEKCKDCPYLPECTSFGKCPIRDSHCRELRELLFITMMKRLIHRGEKLPGSSPDQSALDVIC